MMRNDALSAALAAKLVSTGHNIVFAESCTAGLIAACLARIAGVSEVLAGSAVVYQLATKSKWLNVDPALLEDPGPVSQVVSEQMARGVLQITPHATIAASVTGHLGPNAPDGLDGTAWSTIAMQIGGDVITQSRMLNLQAATSTSSATADDGLSLRHARQTEAAGKVLEFCHDFLNQRC